MSPMVSLLAMATMVTQETTTSGLVLGVVSFPVSHGRPRWAVGFCIQGAPRPFVLLRVRVQLAP